MVYFWCFWVYFAFLFVHTTFWYSGEAIYDASFEKYNCILIVFFKESIELYFQKYTCIFHYCIFPTMTTIQSEEPDVSESKKEEYMSFAFFYLDLTMFELYNGGKIWW